MSNVAVKTKYQGETVPVARQKTDVRIMRGTGASSGVAMGPCRVITSFDDLKSVKAGEILVYRTASPYLVPFMVGLRGLVTEVGGRLTTVAHHARENALPHVAGVGGILANVTDGQIIRLDGSKGTVSLL
jgi:pyruvate, water dikinase